MAGEPALRHLDLTSRLLGYEGDIGCIRRAGLGSAPNHRYAFRQALELMNVEGVYGLWAGHDGKDGVRIRRRYCPLVYLATADTEEEAEKIHRQVWNQGLVPHLIIAGPLGIWFCNAFSYGLEAWKSTALFIRAQDIEKSLKKFSHLSANRLKSSIGWNDFKSKSLETVDRRLLDSLAAITFHFSSESSAKPLDPGVTNALIGRLLYFFFLIDRGFVSQSRLHAWGFSTIDLSDEGVNWPIEDFLKLLDFLDVIFNGSIFPILEKDRSDISQKHLRDIVRVLRHGDTVTAAGYQYSFLDYDFSVIRTETLSAIYEMFLHVEDGKAARDSGAHYTPPFLADYVLDRINDSCDFTQAARILDPAAGSGVFLVGAYRRIIEGQLSAGQKSLPLNDLQKILKDCIYAVEWNERAIHVAAFSLYLTMLDYVNLEDEPLSLNRLEGNTKSAEPIFPPLVNSNLFALDFFDPTLPSLPAMSIAVGNPPWNGVDQIGSTHAVEYARSNKEVMPIGDRQVSELFFWKLLGEHVLSGGIVALLVPAKTFLNEQSEEFVEALLGQSRLIGLSDLSHLRYGLFAKARKPSLISSKSDRVSKPPKHAASLLIVEKAKRSEGDWTWLYKPLVPTQPIYSGNGVWTVIHDWTRTEWHPTTELNAKTLFHALLATPIDQTIIAFVERNIKQGRIKTFSDLEKLGVIFRRGDTKQVDPECAIGSGAGANNFDRNLAFDELKNAWVGAPGSKIVPLPQEAFEKSKVSFRPFNSGDIVMLRRDMEAFYVIPPVSFSDSFIGISLMDERTRRSRSDVLKAIAAYLNSRPMMYFAYQLGRRMLTDRRHIELSVVKMLPWPFDGIEDGDFLRLPNLPEAERDALILRRFGIKGDYSVAIDEFVDFRVAMRDGQVPKGALRRIKPESEEIGRYAHSLLAKIDPGKIGYDLSIIERGDADLTCVVISFLRKSGGGRTKQSAADEAIKSFKEVGGSALTHSRFLCHSREHMDTVLIKPNQYFHWTLDRAYTDADAVVSEILSAASAS